jgi:hypothetical protein
VADHSRFGFRKRSAGIQSDSVLRFANSFQWNDGLPVSEHSNDDRAQRLVSAVAWRAGVDRKGPNLMSSVRLFL